MAAPEVEVVVVRVFQVQYRGDALLDELGMKGGKGK